MDKKERLDTILTKRGKVRFSKTKVNLQHLGAKVSDDSANLANTTMPVANQKYMVEPIFPTPLYKTSLFNVYREEHQEWISKLEREPNNGNVNSVNKHVFHDEAARRKEIRETSRIGGPHLRRFLGQSRGRSQYGNG